MNTPVRCRRCIEQDQPPDCGDIRCAFMNGTFEPDNWNCATMNTLRELGQPLGNEQGSSGPMLTYVGDQRAKLIPIDSDLQAFIVLGWYKSRGSTEAAYVLHEQRIAPLPLWLAEIALKDRPVDDAAIEGLDYIFGQ